MCGRYAVTRDPAALAEEFDAVDATASADPTADYNIAPSKDVVTVVQRHPRDGDGAVLSAEPAVRSLRTMRWGLVPFWAKDPAVGNRMINTRAETAKEKSAFRKALARRRCLLPADGWFEWRAGSAGEAQSREPTRKGAKKPRKEPFFMTGPDGSSLAFAGLWESWRDPSAAEEAPPLVTCSVLTTEAVGRLAGIHHRMPVLMASENWNDWLDPDNTDAAGMLDEVPRELVDSLELRPVSTRVNDVRNNGPELIERVDPERSDSTGALFGLPDN